MLLRIQETQKQQEYNITKTYTLVKSHGLCLHVVGVSNANMMLKSSGCMYYLYDFALVELEVETLNQSFHLLYLRSLIFSIQT